jgi:hypothetical protein
MHTHTHTLPYTHPPLHTHTHTPPPSLVHILISQTIFISDNLKFPPRVFPKPNHHPLLSDFFMHIVIDYSSLIEVLERNTFQTKTSRVSDTISEKFLLRVRVNRKNNQTVHGHTHLPTQNEKLPCDQTLVLAIEQSSVFLTRRLLLLRFPCCCMLLLIIDLFISCFSTVVLETPRKVQGKVKTVTKSKNLTRTLSMFLSFYVWPWASVCMDHDRCVFLCVCVLWVTSDISSIF